jgi:DNA primase
LISRWTDKVFICFDADDTGICKAKDAESKFRNHKFSTKIVLLPEGDPDEFVLKHGKQKFLDLLRMKDER